jgi:hypothetical protein
VTIIPFSTSKRLVEPFNRLKNRANLFRRKNYSSQLHISEHGTLPVEQIIPSDRSFSNIYSGDHHQHAGVILLKRSNSMICPQQRLQALRQHRNSNQRNSICVELSGCSTEESSTDDYQLSKSTLNHYWSRAIASTMSHIEENESPLSVITEANPSEQSFKDNG